MKCVLIDFGSTSVKYGLYCTENDTITSIGSCPFPSRIENKEPLIFEVDTHAIHRILLDILKLIAVQADAIFISTQMHGYILADEYGKPVSPYISWRDRRAALLSESTSYMDQLKNECHLEIPSHSGTTLKDNLPVCSIYTTKWLHPKLLQSSRNFFTLGSYLAFFLTGINSTHISDAAASGFYDSVTCERLVGLFPELTLPKATRVVEKVGSWNGIAVYSPIGDHQATFLGSGTDGDTEYLLNIGTATQISTLSDVFSDTYECRPFFHDKILATISGLIGGRDIEKQYNANPAEFQAVLTENYRKAFTGLPKKQSLVVTGGAAVHYSELINNVCKQLNLPYTIINKPDALMGLKKLVNEVLR